MKSPNLLIVIACAFSLLGLILQTVAAYKPKPKVWEAVSLVLVSIALGLILAAGVVHVNETP